MPTAASTETKPSARHTPGPWHWDSDALKGDPLGRVRYRVVAKGRTITELYYPSGDGFAEADGRLIAAAPELLAVLQSVQFELSALRELPYGREAQWHQLSHRVDAAIAKAEG
jgi:hypothetical protein